MILVILLVGLVHGLKLLNPLKKSGWALFESIAPHLPMVKQNGSQNGIVATNLQLARGC